MGFYGEKVFDNEYSGECKSVLENYIEDNFLESTFDDTAINILDQIYSCENSSVDDSVELLKSVSEQLYYSCINDNTKTKILNSLGRVIYGVRENSILLYESDETLLEFKGNDVKNQEFIDFLEEIEEICNFNLVKIRKLADYSEKILNNAKAIAKSGSAKMFSENIDKSREYAGEYNEWKDKAGGKINAPLSFNQFTRSSRSFNNKYSSVTMEEKKKLDAKLRKFEKEIRKLAEPWTNDGEKMDEMCNIADDLYNIDKNYYDVFIRNFVDLNKLFIYEVNATLDDIGYAYNVLNIKKEKSFLYKAINKIIK